MDEKSIKSWIAVIAAVLVAIVVFLNLDIIPDKTPDNTFTCKIMEEVVYNASGIKMTTKGFNKDGIWGPEIKVIVENSTDKNLNIYGNDFVVNGITIEGTAFISVNAGSKAAGSIYLLESELETAGIKNIATISTYNLTAYDAGDSLVNYNIQFDIQTSLADTHKQEAPSHKEVIFQQDDIKISPCGTVDGNMCQSVVFLVTNGYGQDVLLSAKDVSINGFTVPGYTGDYVYKDTSRFWRIDVSDSYLKDCGIDRIEEIKLSINIINLTTDQTIAETGELQIHIQN